MAKTQMKKCFNKSPLSSSSKAKLKRMITWDMKRKLVRKRLMDLDNKSNDGDSVALDKPIVPFPAKVKTASDDGARVAASPSAMDRAEEVQANLPLKFPSFVKRMLMSHVTGGFWLGLPSQFCRSHLPEDDETIVLVDEDEQEYDTKYLAKKNGLSGGWRGFAIAHQLQEGDVLVFQLIKPHKFKLYIVRKRTLTEVDGAMSLLNLDPHAEPIQAVNMEVSQPDEDENAIQTRQEPDHQTKNTELVPLSGSPTDQSGAESDNLCSDIAEGEGIIFSQSPLSFKDVHSFKDFKIQVDGLILDSEIPIHLRKKYYDLCLSQDTFLHDNLITGLNSKLVSGMISETINISDAIRAINPKTSLDHLEGWDRTLKAFQDLGFLVGFLRSRIEKLLKMARDARARVESKTKERDEAEKEVTELRVKLSNAEKLVKRLDGEMDDLEVLNDEINVVFKDVASALW